MTTAHDTSVAVALCDAQRRLFVVKLPAAKRWQLAQSTIKHGENGIAALRRLLDEQLGLEPQNYTILGESPSTEMQPRTFAVRISTTASILLNSGIRDHRFVTEPELQDYIQGDITAATAALKLFRK